MKHLTAAPSGTTSALGTEITSLVNRVTENHMKANEAAAEAVRYAVEVGNDLLELKKQVEHGRWADFVYENFPFKIRAAQNYMRLASDPEKTQRVAHLGVKGALAELAEPKGLVTIEAPGDGSPDQAGHVRKVEEAAAECPAAVAEALTGMAPETQRQVADALIRATTTEPSLKRVAEGPKRHPRIPKSPERKLGDATFLLWDVSQMLLDEVPSGEEQVRMISDAQKSQRLATGIEHLLTTGELDEALRELLDEAKEGAARPSEPDPDLFELRTQTINVEKGEVIDTADRSPYDRLARFLGGVATSLPQFAGLPIDQAMAEMPAGEKSVWIDVIRETRGVLSKFEQAIGEDEQ